MSNKMDSPENRVIINNPINFKYYKLTKLSDDKFSGKHPNDIYERHTVYGTSILPPDPGQSFVLSNVTGDSFGYFYTSMVTELLDENTFKTLNSTYKFEELPIPEELILKQPEERKKITDEEFIQLLDLLS